MRTGKYELLIKWPSGQSTHSGEITDQQYGEICRVLSPDIRTKLAALKAGQGEAVAEVSAETFSSDGTSDIITCNLPIGTKLYLSAPPASADARLVELLERIVEHLEYDAIGCPSEAIAGDLAKELRALLAQSESEGVKL